MSDNVNQSTHSASSESTEHQAPSGRPGRGPGSHPMGPVEKPKNFGTTMKRMVGYLGAYRAPIIVVLVLAIASTVFLVFGPRLQGFAVDELLSALGIAASTGAALNLGTFARIVLSMLVLYGLSAVFSYVMGWIMTGISVNISYRLRRDIEDKMNRLPMRFFDRTSHGEVLSRITNDVDTVNQTLSQSLTQVITSLVRVVGMLIMMLSIDWRLTLISIIMIPLSMTVVAAIVKRSQGYFKEQQASLGRVNGHVEEMYSGHTVVKAFNAEHKAIEAFDVHNEELHRSAWKSQFLSGLMMPVMVIFGNISYVAVAVVGGYLTAAGALTIGAISSFIQYIRQFNQPLTQIANLSNILQQTAAAAERVFEFLDENEEIAETSSPVHLEQVKGEVRIEHITFGYNKDQPVINNFSAKAEPGKKVAIVGPTGAGKSTIVKLLMRFYDVDQGGIFLDGQEITHLTREELRSQFAMVLQDSWLYNASVMENIRYGRPDASDAEVMEAAKAASVDHFVRTWPGGYDMVINEETSNISQGQKQLLTIARAILADPRILILDEATSSVDTRTEELIQKAMDVLMHGRTSFVIAHRLSTIRNADLILVMNQGDVIEQGTHDELLAAGGFYADLYNSQFETEDVLSA